MLSKNKIKQINALSHKKTRDELGLFIAEGSKVVGDFLKVFTCNELFYTSDCGLALDTVENKHLISHDELKKISLLVSPQHCFAVFSKPQNEFSNQLLDTELCLLLDDIQDPGNLGTIIRIADWFGIKHVFCSLHTADVYNPKTIQATMGALAKVQIHMVDIVAFLDQLPANVSVYGTHMDGADIYNEKLENYGLIILGNEGKGIQPACEKFINKRLYIPDYPQGMAASESLNVAVAAAVVCAEFRRRVR